MTILSLGNQEPEATPCETAKKVLVMYDELKGESK